MPLKIDKNFHANFPEVDWKHPHLIAAEMKFGDGLVARREIVVGGAVADTAQSELTPILLTQTSPEQPLSFENCLLMDGQPVRTAAVEKPSALVFFVRDPDRSEAVRALDPTRQMLDSYFPRAAVVRSVPLDKDTGMRFLWPVVTKFADPVAVAGLRAISESRRRAVVLILSKHPDSSGNDPRVVRRYLADIGVPFFVWSLNGPRPDVSDSWGEVEDVSSFSLLEAAAAKLRDNLAAQRIAWVDVDPLKALRLRADSRCGVTTVARSGM